MDPYTHVITGNLPGVQACLNANWNPNEKVAFGSYALSLATSAGNFELTKLLIENGAIVSPKKDVLDWNISPIVGAFHSGSVDIAEYLMERGAKLNILCLKYACLNHYIDAAEYILDRGEVNINEQDESGYTVLHILAQHGNYRETTELLINYGAHVNTKTIHGSTPLALAYYYGFFDMMRILIQSGADVNAPQGANLYILDACAISANPTQFLAQRTKHTKYLIANGARRCTYKHVKNFVHRATLYALLIDKINAADVLHFIHEF